MLSNKMVIALKAFQPEWQSHNRGAIIGIQLHSIREFFHHWFECGVVS